MKLTRAGTDKILVFNPFGIGDFLFTTPLLKNIKSFYPSTSLTYICNRRVYPLARYSEFIDQVLVFEKDEWRKTLKESKISFLKKFTGFIRNIRNEGFDIVFDLSMNAQYGFFLKICRIKTRIGYDFKGRGKFLTHKKNLPYGFCEKHVALYHLDLLHFLGKEAQACGLCVTLPPLDPSKIDNFFVNKDKDILRIAVFAGSGDSWAGSAYFKRWPKEKFYELCLKLKEELKAEIILLGSAGEADICAYIEDNLGGQCINFCSKIGLKELCHILSRCSLLVTNDGGPFHLGQALGVKAVGLFGPVDEKVYGCYPRSDKCHVLKSDIECRPCYRSFKFPGCKIDRQCLKNIGTEEVFSRIENLL